jgi:hypothetical protein
MQWPKENEIGKYISQEINKIFIFQICYSSFTTCYVFVFTAVVF